ncbi:MAG: hypothetical protein A2Y07_02445 [Planctomycetes bacterium GWF2_50_10]|nr:MAG: hypothetical protein A2Y07_02445 [Planctomycetes bacterium GWF2_50_10]
MYNLPLQTLAFSMPGGLEWVIILVVAVLIFGNRLPEVAKGLGKSIAELKHGLKEASQIKDGIKDDIDSHVSQLNPVDDIKNEIDKA